MLGYNVSNEVDRNNTDNKEFKAKICPKIVEDSITIIEESLKDK